MSIADLHIHSVWSDGSQNIKEIIQDAKSKSLQTISITDHDTVIGTKEALYWAEVFDIRVIPGIEISAYDFESQKKVHILGYNYDLPAPHISALCAPILRARHEKTLSHIYTLESAGFPISLEKVKKVAGESPVLYKQHIMQVLINEGFCDQLYGSTYRKIFKGDGICNSDITYVAAIDAVKAIRADGGVAVLAHPGLQNSLHLLPELVEVGLWGIELHHESNSDADIKAIKAAAAEYDLALTGGSDSHGTFGSIHEIGDIIAPHALQFPDKRNLPERLSFIKTVLPELGDYVSSVDNVNPEYKNNDHSDLLTICDTYVESLITSKITRKYPEDQIITEETKASISIQSEYCWIIDPIDGTTNFSRKKQDFAISIACFKNGMPFFGLVYDVHSKDVYEGVHKKGAWRNGIQLAPLNAVSHLKRALVDFSLMSVSIFQERWGVDLSPLAKLVMGHRSKGSASLIICEIAAGKGDVYLSAKLHIWDHAAAGLILREVGGYTHISSDFSAQNNCRQGHVFLAASGKTISEELLRKIQNERLSLTEIKHFKEEINRYKTEINLV